MAAVIVPTPGREVMYRSKTSNYALPAKVSVTIDNLYYPGVDAGDIGGISSPLHAHLVVFSPGPESYREHDCPHASMHPDFDEQSNPWPPGSWVWPHMAPDRVFDSEAPEDEQHIEALPYVWSNP